MCETPTKFNDLYKLYKHRVRFHLAFDQKNKGKKRVNNDDDDKVSPKKIRWNGTKILADDVADADTDENNGENNEEGYEDDTDEGSDIPQIRFG